MLRSIKEKKIVFKLKNIHKNDPVDRIRGVNVVKMLQSRGWDASLYTNQKNIDILIHLDSLDVNYDILARYHILDVQDNHLNRDNSASRYIFAATKKTLIQKIYNEYKYNRKSFYKKLKRKFFPKYNYQVIVQKADYIICSSCALKAYYSKYHDRCKYICDSVEKYMAFTGNKSSQISICWVGTKNNIVYLKIVEKVMVALQKKYKIKFSIITSKDVFMESPLRDIMDNFMFEYDFIEWNSEKVFDDISQHHIAIAPLPEGVDKSTNKILTYMATSVPTVCSGATDYKKLFSEHSDAFCFVDNEYSFWFETLESLIINEGYRNRLSKKGFHLAEQYSLEKNIEKYENLFFEILTKK